jgi:hypothetical protein
MYNFSSSFSKGILLLLDTSKDAVRTLLPKGSMRVLNIGLLAVVVLDIDQGLSGKFKVMYGPMVSKP